MTGRPEACLGIPEAERAQPARIEWYLRTLAARCCNRDGKPADETLVVLTKTDAQMIRNAARLVMLVTTLDEDLFMDMVMRARRRTQR